MRKGDCIQFCPHGHDTFVTGRYKDGHCKECRKQEKKYVPNYKNQFCPKGHNLFIVGRDKGGHCKECKREWDREYREKHKMELKEKKHKYYEDNVVRINEHAKQYYEENKEKYKQRNNKNKAHINERDRQRLATDITFKLKKKLRNRLRKAIVRNFKGGSAVKDLGCSIEFLKEYIESKFYGEMTWDNWGKVWELDHVKALMFFDLTNREAFLKAAHYTNLQPLIIEDHKKKTALDKKKRKKH